MAATVYEGTTPPIRRHLKTYQQAFSSAWAKRRTFRETNQTLI